MYIQNLRFAKPGKYYYPIPKQDVNASQKAMQSINVPKTDISEDDKNIYFDFELPGLKKENIDFRINEDNILSLTAKKYSDNGHSNNEDEMKFEEFKRSFKLEGNFEEENIKARFENGVLQVTVPKRLPVEKEISIN